MCTPPALTVLRVLQQQQRGVGHTFHDASPCHKQLRLGFGVWGLGFGVWGLGFGVWGLVFGVWGLGFGVWGLGFGIWVLGFGCHLGFNFLVAETECYDCAVGEETKQSTRPHIRAKFMQIVTQI